MGVVKADQADVNQIGLMMTGTHLSDIKAGAGGVTNPA